MFLHAVELALERGFYHVYDWLATRRRKRLTGEFTSFVKNIAPDAEIVNIMIPGYEELDAWLDIVVPDAREEEISDALSNLRDKFFDDKKFHIGLGITERAQYETTRAKLKFSV